MDMFEDPGLPNPDGTFRYTHSYTPGRIYNSESFVANLCTQLKSNDDDSY